MKNPSVYLFTVAWESLLYTTDGVRVVQAMMMNYIGYMSYSTEWASEPDCQHLNLCSATEKVGNLEQVPKSCVPPVISIIR